MKKDIIIFDIDGTLSLTGDRKECLTRTPKDWDEFYMRAGEDGPNTPIIQTLIALELFTYNTILLVTGRRESCREDTINWLSREGLAAFPSKNLYMRPDNDYRPDTILKPELIRNFLPRILMAFEDRTCMVNKWRELGITCLQVDEGVF